MNKKKFIDISRSLSSATAVWPGDSKFFLVPTMKIDEAQSVNLTTITMSAHTGTHADAPRHFNQGGKSIDQVNVAVYWGPAQVVTTTRKSGALAIKDFAAYDLTLAPRLLVRTPAGSVPSNLFPQSISYPSPQLIEYLGSLDICLYGTDALSVDDIESKSLPGHNTLLNNNISILEGLDLRAVPDGLYELSALPLKIENGDGSPVRAVLRQLD